MKKTLFYMSAFAAAASIAGCELMSEEYSNVSSDLYPTTERDARDIVTANAYAPLGNNGYSGAFNAATGYHLLSDMATDIGFCSWGDGNWGQLQWARFLSEDGSRNPRMRWGDMVWLSRMELSIDRIKGVSMDETLKARLVGELECGQGFLAFLLWDFYGGLVIADLETLKNPQEAAILPRKTSDETADYIEAKLKSAAAALPKTIAYGSADYGRFTGGLAKTLLLKLYMQQRLYEKAEPVGRELTDGTYGYALVTTRGSRESAYANIFSDDNEGNSETIWAVNGLRDYSSHLWRPHVIDWGGYHITRTFMQTFETGDQRMGGQVIDDDNGSANGTMPLKYEMENRSGDEVFTDWIVYRYADVLTLLSEAIVMNGGWEDATKKQEAITLLNRVRTRAGLTAYTDADFSNKEDFIEKLLMERAHELWFEGVRRQDLIRHRKYVETMRTKCNNYSMSTDIVTLGEKSHLFPLPSSAINEFIKGGFTGMQNPGYGE
jgi:hypothetical protein